VEFGLKAHEASVGEKNSILPTTPASGVYQRIWCKKARFLRLLPRDVDCETTGLDVLVELQLVTDGQTDGLWVIAHDARVEMHMLAT